MWVVAHRAGIFGTSCRTCSSSALCQLALRHSPVGCSAAPSASERLTHAVEDVDRWLTGKDKRAAAWPGAADLTDLVAMDGSSHAAVAFDNE